MGADITDEESAILAGRDRDAIRHIERARTAKAINEATREYEAGNAEAAMRVLNVRQQEAKEIAESISDQVLGAELDRITREVDKDFKAAPAKPSSRAGKRAQKKNRNKAYKLMY